MVVPVFKTRALCRRQSGKIGKLCDFPCERDKFSNNPPPHRFHLERNPDAKEKEPYYQAIHTMLTGIVVILQMDRNDPGRGATPGINNNIIKLQKKKYDEPLTTSRTHPSVAGGNYIGQSSTHHPWHIFVGGKREPSRWQVILIFLINWNHVGATVRGHLIHSSSSSSSVVAGGGKVGCLYGWEIGWGWVAAGWLKSVCVVLWRDWCELWDSWWMN